MAESVELSARSCEPCADGTPPLATDAGAQLMTALHDDWIFSVDGKAITRAFAFTGYQKTIAFVNAVARIAEKEGHHPDLTVSYGKVGVLYTTHSTGGLSENDFICAAKIDRL